MTARPSTTKKKVIANIPTCDAFLRNFEFIQINWMTLYLNGLEGYYVITCYRKCKIKRLTSCTNDTAQIK
ncbi:unnamed protein product [Ixodes persulcatus]